MRKFGPKRFDHPSIGVKCSVCLKPFKAGDYTTLRFIRPADDEEQKRADAGQVHTALAEEVHWSCATGNGEAMSAERALHEVEEAERRAAEVYIATRDVADAEYRAQAKAARTTQERSVAVVRLERKAKEAAAALTAAMDAAWAQYRRATGQTEETAPTSEE